MGSEDYRESDTQTREFPGEKSKRIGKANDGGSKADVGIPDSHSEGVFSVRIEGFPFGTELVYCIRRGHAKESNGIV